MVDVRSRIHRILRPLTNFRMFSDESPLPIVLREPLPLGASEHVFGVYATDLAGLSDVIVFTDEGLYWLWGQQRQRVLYTDIERTILPEPQSEVTGFKILRRDGTEAWLPVKGSKAGRFFDAFEVLRFLDRVKEGARSDS